MKIRVFKAHAGEGGSSFSAENLRRGLTEALQPFGFSISFITARDIREGKLLNPDDTQMLVLGGGRFSEVKRAFGPIGLQNIENYTHDGGIYTGVCMGSYAAFPDIDFSGQDKRRGQGLKFFNATARGSLPIALPYDATAKSATIIEVNHMHHGIKFPSLYWGGNGMDEAELVNIGATPLSKITLPQGGEKVMSAQIDVGGNGGKAFTCSYHPEAYRWNIIWDWLKGLSGDNKECYTRLYHEMMQHPDKAYMMAMACLLDDIQLVEGHSFVRQVNRMNQVKQDAGSKTQPSGIEFPEESMPALSAQNFVFR